jgi:hypothetical protein
MFVLKSGRLYSKMGILPTLQARAAQVGPVRLGLEFGKGILPISSPQKDRFAPKKARLLGVCADQGLHECLANWPRVGG